MQSGESDNLVISISPPLASLSLLSPLNAHSSDSLILVAVDKITLIFVT